VKPGFNNEELRFGLVKTVSKPFNQDHETFSQLKEAQGCKTM